MFQQRTDLNTCVTLHGHGRKPCLCIVGTSSSALKVSQKLESFSMIGVIERRIKAQNLDSVLGNVLPSLLEASDELLEISVNVLEHKVEHSLAFFVQSLLNVHQPGDEEDVYQ